MFAFDAVFEIRWANDITETRRFEIMCRRSALVRSAKKTTGIYVSTKRLFNSGMFRKTF
ncbi:hypothetical protein FDI40_gp688 [Agrobacterium phage Atu_ph07]|uniref:Uncharacterized protein n=1 Tax=Agrobacterium phage Atu_ph07 TaxID=2024264 RepID=A0A2L0V0W0_9CAUD|nr:hypothetical protein FDI40_gp688 [Agrobacterium phage Atu_ph07]AUZ95434.1 hypothetical protein [Agrobacterium phage Atu_ph07]